MEKEQIDELIETTLVDMRKAQLLGGEHYHVMPVKEAAARKILHAFVDKYNGATPVDESVVDVKGHGVSTMNAHGELDGMLGGLTSESVDSSIVSAPLVDQANIPHATELDSPDSDSEIQQEDIVRDENANPITITPQVGAANEYTQEPGQSPVAEEYKSERDNQGHVDPEYPSEQPVQVPSPTEEEAPVAEQGAKPSRKKKKESPLTGADNSVDYIETAETEKPAVDQSND